ncbi:DegT/DnrJ/EryC1/StrS family aminotransferase [Paludisphaera sp.]|uniref:DegT/DnrJ/EryC1/StrS family aminotransferase n=1 Tax=Paludisphaera sp. TaxID=2017432 RepID=UPI00301CB5B9
MALPYEPAGVPALNLRAQYHAIRDEIEPVVREVMETQGFVMGPEVAGLEAEIAEYCGAGHAIGCASGTDALLLPLMAIDLGPGDEVITTPYTFFATGGSIWRAGARPVFVDIEPDTFNIDPGAIEAAITERTKAIIPVHLYGQTADMDPIREIAASRGLMVLEDAAQAIGAAYHGRRAGTLGTAAAFSFYPSKNLGGFGDGGMIATDDPVLARRLARLRVHGMEPKYHHHEVGLNSRLDALQAAILRVKLRHLDAWTAARREVADRYRELFASHGLEEMVQLPIERPGNFHVYNQFVVRVPGAIRDDMRQYLTDRKIGTEIYYPIPLHLQPCFASLGYRPGDFPRTEAAARETIALPIYPELAEAEQRYVVGAMHQFLHERAHPSLSTDRAA